MIVIDVGCMPHGPEESVNKLVERFQPEILFGFDPHPDLVEGVERINGSVVVRRQAAAWTHDGNVLVDVDGIVTGIHTEERLSEGTVCDCFDFARWLRSLPTRGPLVVKMDCEGSEFPLLNALVESGQDARLERVLVEWHTGEFAHGLEADRPTLRCSVELW